MTKNMARSFVLHLLGACIFFLVISPGCDKTGNPAAADESDQTAYFKSLGPMPEPPEGYQWKVDMRFSDDFNGTELDRSKWHDHHPYWKGRPPAKFMPEAISVKDGTLQIKCGILAQPDGDFTMRGGAVVSKSEDAGFGYYEARFMATQISMSSTFWLTGDDGRHSYPSVGGEIDIVETVGGAIRWPNFATHMMSNTHVHYRPTEGELQTRSVGGNTPIGGRSGEGFHTYGAWWVDENTIHFYCDGEYRFTIYPDTTLVADPMRPGKYVNLVSETYDWEYPPTGLQLQNDDINTTYYDWVRAFKLEPVEK